jgi:hypothetical protein
LERDVLNCHTSTYMAPPPDRDPLTDPEWSRVRRVPLIRREIREFLSPNAMEILFDAAEALVECGLDDDGTAAYATVMVTVELAAVGTLIREPADAATAVRLAELLQQDGAVARRLAQLARPYLCDVAERSIPASSIEIEHTARAEGERLLVDGDAMVSLVKAAAEGSR